MEAEAGRSPTLYEPSAWGQFFHSLTMNEALGGGSAGPGKSMVLLMDCNDQILVEHERCLDKHHPHHIKWGQSKGWTIHLRRTFPRLETTISRASRIFSSMDPDCHYDKETHTFIFKSGYRYQFGHCQHEKDVENFQGKEYSAICYDELIEFEKEQYFQINTRLRVSDPVLSKMRKVRSMTNPVHRQDGNSKIIVRDPQWVRKRFVDPAPKGNTVLTRWVKRKDGERVARTRIYVPATLYDNPDPQFVRDYELELLDKPAHIQAALLRGNWYVTAGSFYADVWDERLHVVDPFRIPGDWPIFRAMDWGFKTWGCIGWFAMDPEGNLIMIKEFNFRYMDAADVARRVREIEEKLGVWSSKNSKITGPADTQLWEQRGDTGASKVQDFAKLGVGWLQADKGPGSRARAGERITARLRDHRAGKASPGLLLFAECTQAIKTLPSIQTDLNDPNSPAKGGDDHWHDMIAYAVSYASRGRVGRSVEEVKTKAHPDDWDDKLDKMASRPTGTFGYGSML